MDRLRVFIAAAARLGGIPPQQNGKWLIFGKESRAQPREWHISTGRRNRIGFCALHA
jgi:hypothetical protein